MNRAQLIAAESADIRSAIAYRGDDDRLEHTLCQLYAATTELKIALADPDQQDPELRAAIEGVIKAVDRAAWVEINWRERTERASKRRKRRRT